MYKVIRIEQNLYFDNDINDLDYFPNLEIKDKTYKIKRRTCKRIFLSTKKN